MASLVEQAAQTIADALAPSPSAPSARWRWGTVVSVNNTGTMNVSIGGATVPGIRAAQHCMGAQVGDRVRVMYCGTEAIVDAVRASSEFMSVPAPSMDDDAKAAWLDALGLVPLFHFKTVSSSSASVASGSVVEFTATIPAVSGMTCRGAVQVWTSGTGTTIVGAPWRTSGDNVIHAKVRGNVASNVSVGWLLFYTADAFTTVS